MPSKLENLHLQALISFHSMMTDTLRNDAIVEHVLKDL